MTSSGSARDPAGRGLQHPRTSCRCSPPATTTVALVSMPYIEGESLRSALKQRERLPARDVGASCTTWSMRSVCAARGVVHRDIKPDNILTSGRHAMVTDFGVAKPSARPSRRRAAPRGHAIGTPAYMARSSARRPCRRSCVDLYAVGLLAYELSGTSPFTHVAAGTLAAQLTKTPSHRIARSATSRKRCLRHHELPREGRRAPSGERDRALAELDALPPMGSARSPPRRRNPRAPLVLGRLPCRGAVVVFAQRTKQTGRQVVRRSVWPTAFRSRYRPAGRARDGVASGARSAAAHLVAHETGS